MTPKEHIADGDPACRKCGALGIYEEHWMGKMTILRCTCIADQKIAEISQQLRESIAKLSNQMVGNTRAPSPKEPQKVDHPSAPCSALQDYALCVLANRREALESRPGEAAHNVPTIDIMGAIQLIQAGIPNLRDAERVVIYHGETAGGVASCQPL